MHSPKHPKHNSLQKQGRSIISFFHQRKLHDDDDGGGGDDYAAAADDDDDDDDDFGDGVGGIDDY